MNYAYDEVEEFIAPGGSEITLTDFLDMYEGRDIPVMVVSARDYDELDVFSKDLNSFLVDHEPLFTIATEGKYRAFSYLKDCYAYAHVQAFCIVGAWMVIGISEYKEKE